MVLLVGDDEEYAKDFTKDLTTCNVPATDNVFVPEWALKIEEHEHLAHAYNTAIEGISPQALFHIIIAGICKRRVQYPQHRSPCYIMPQMWYPLITYQAPEALVVKSVSVGRAPLSAFSQVHASGKCQRGSRRQGSAGGSLTGRAVTASARVSRNLCVFLFGAITGACTHCTFLYEDPMSALRSSWSKA